MKRFRKALTMLLAVLLVLQTLPLSGALAEGDCAVREGCTLGAGHDGACETLPPEGTDTLTLPEAEESAAPEPPAPEDTPAGAPAETPAPEEPEAPAPNTPAPEEPETPVPEESATPVPEGTATPAPTETVTPVPEESATPAPETPDALAALIAASGEAVYAEDATLTADLTIPKDMTLTLAGTLTVPAGMTLRNEGALILTGLMHVYGALYNAADATITVRPDAERYPDAQQHLTVYAPQAAEGVATADGTLTNEGEIALAGALYFEAGAQLLPDDEGIKKAEGGSVTFAEAEAVETPFEEELSVTAALVQTGDIPAEQPEITTFALGEGEAATYDAASEEQLAAAAQAIYDGMNASLSSIALTAYDLTEAQLKTVFETVVNDHPMFFYVSGTYGYRLDGTTKLVTTLLPRYTMSGATLTAAKTFVNSEIATILDCVDASMTTQGKLLALSDYLCLHYQYSPAGAYKYDIYSMLTQGDGVCQAYTLLYKELLNRLNIDNRLAPSTAMNHIWNYALVDGNWYHIDVTWNDAPNTIYGTGKAYHTNFLLSDEGIAKTRTPHHSWIHNAVANDKTYDTYFWQDVATPFAYLNGNWYAIDDVQYTSDSGNQYWGIVRRCDLTNAAGFDTTFVVRTNGRWASSGCHSGLGVIAGKLLFNTPTKLYTIDPATSAVVLLKDIGMENNRQVYEFYLTGDTVTYLYSEHSSSNGVIQSFVAEPYDGNLKLMLGERDATNGVFSYNINTALDATFTLSAVPNPAKDGLGIGWRSSNESAVSVDNTGKVTVHRASEGEATITAYATDGSYRSASMIIRVYRYADSVSISGDTGALSYGKSTRLTATVLPEDARYRTVTWSIQAGDEALATVDASGLVTANTLPGNATDTVTVVATAKDPDQKKGTYDIVISPAVTAVQIFDGATELTGRTTLYDLHEKSASIALTTTLTPATSAAGVGFTSSDEAIATVAQTGVVTFTGTKLGTVTITARALDGSDVSATAAFQAYYVDPAAKLTADGRMVENGEETTGVPVAGVQPQDKVQMHAFGADAATPLDKTLFTYASSNEAVATVDSATGLITVIGPVGAAAYSNVTITATLTGDPLARTAALTLKVIPLQTDAIYIIPDVTGMTPAPVVVMYDVADEVTTDAARAVRYEIRLDKSAIPSGGSTFTVRTEGKKGGVQTTVVPNYGVSDASILSIVTDGATGIATVTVRGGSEGAATLTATARDLNRAQNSLTVSVADYAPRLGAASIPLNPLLTVGATVPLVESYGNAITDVALYEYDAAARDYSATASTRFTLDYNGADTLTLSAATNIANGTVKARLTVTTGRGAYYFPISLAVRGTQPSFSVKQSERFNVFYKDSEVVLTATSSADILDVSFETEDFEAVGDASMPASQARVAFKSGRAVAKPVVRGTVYVTFEGYRNPVGKAFTLSTVTTKPVYALSATSATVNTAYGDRSAAVSILERATKQPVALASANDVTLLSASPAGFVQLAVTDAAEGALLLTLNPLSGAYVGGVATIALQDANWTSALTFSYRITANTRLPSAKFASGALRVNSAFPSEEVTAVTLNQGGVSLDAARRELVFAGAARLVGEAAKISVVYDGGAVTAKLLDANTIPANGAYRYAFTPLLDQTDAQGNPIALSTIYCTVTIHRTQPRASLKSATLRLNSAYGGEELASTLIAVNTAGYAATGATVTNRAGNPLSESALSVRFEGGALVASLGAANAVANGTYQYTVTPTVENAAGASGAVAPLTLRVTVYRTAASASISASGKLDTLNPASFDRANTTAGTGVLYTLTRLNNIAGVATDAAILSEGDGDKFALSDAMMNAKGQMAVMLKLVPGQSYSTARTYRIRLAYTLDGFASPVLTPWINVRVTQSSMRITAAPTKLTVYQSQSASATARAVLRMVSPATGEIASVTLNGATSPALVTAMGAGGFTATRNADGTYAVALKIANMGALVKNRTYVLALNVLPENCAENLAARPTVVRISVRVSA